MRVSPEGRRRSASCHDDDHPKVRVEDSSLSSSSAASSNCNLPLVPCTSPPAAPAPFFCSSSSDEDDLTCNNDYNKNYQNNKNKNSASFLPPSVSTSSSTSTFFGYHDEEQPTIKTTTPRIRLSPQDSASSSSSSSSSTSHSSSLPSCTTTKYSLLKEKRNKELSSNNSSHSSNNNGGPNSSRSTNQTSSSSSNGGGTQRLKSNKYAIGHRLTANNNTNNNMNNNLNEKEQEYTIIHDQEDLTAKNNNSSFAQINTIHNKNKNTNNHNNNHNHNHQYQNKNKNTNNHNNNHNHNHQYHNHVVIPNHNNSNSSNNNNITINNNNSPIKVDRPLVVARAGSGSGNGNGSGSGREFEYCPWCGRRFQLGEQACPRCRTPRGRAPFVEPAVGPSSPPKVPWRKILYEQQPYEDNYTDKTFLLGLIRNAHKREYDTKTIILDSSTVTQQLCCIALFIVIFIEIYDHNLSLDFILGGEALLTALGFLLRLLFDPKFTMKGMLRAGKSVVVITLTLFGFSPVLRTLVQPFSNDTIWALSISFLLIHIFFHDYGYTHGTSERMDAPVSLNAAIFASVLLGSRLSNSMEVFALLCTAVQVFALFPVVRHHVKRASMKLHLGLTFVLFLITAVCFLELSSTVGIMYIITIVSITFVGPIWLKWLQRYKDEISGPWDEAVPCLN